MGVGGTGGRQGRRPKWAWGWVSHLPTGLRSSSTKLPDATLTPALLAGPKAWRSFPGRQDPGGQEEPESSNHRAPMWQVPATGPHRCLNSTLVALALLSPPDWRNDKEF